MGNAKFSMNALLLVVILFSAALLLITVKLTAASDFSAVNEVYPLEGTDLWVRYSSVQPYGLYTGSRNSGTLRLKGTFGHDWGAAVRGNYLYINEYTTTDLGLMLSRLVRVDLRTYEKEVLRRDALLRGTCASGELVCLGGSMLPSCYPKTNPLCRLYAMSDPELRPEGDGALVLFLDPDTGETLFSLRDENALDEGFEERCQQRTLSEVMG